MKAFVALFGRRFLAAAGCGLLALASAPEARAGFPAPGTSAASRASLRAEDEERILAVLQERIGDPALREKAEAKLASLGEEEIRLIAGLCERIGRGREGLATDVAFLLVGALVVTS